MVLTICLIEISTLQNQISSSIVGQGDNQVLSLRLKIPIYRNPVTNILEPNYQLVKSKLNKFRTDFLKLCKDAGLPVRFKFGDRVVKKCKGIARSVVDAEIDFNNYKDCLFNKIL